MKKFIWNTQKINKKFSFEIYNVSSIEKPQNNSIIFYKGNEFEKLDKIKDIKNSIIIISDKFKSSFRNDMNLIIFHKNPRFEFFRILKLIMKESKLGKIEKNIKIGNGTIIDKTVFLGNNISIGDNCIIEAGVKIKDNVSLGNNCYIGENSVIGGEGVGFSYNDEKLYNAAHIGGVIIGNDVEIGPLCNIVSGRIEPSIIADNVIIGGSAYIAHDVKIEKNTLINVRAVICGNVEIGKNVVIGPNSTISDNLKIKDNAIVSLGSTVVSKVKSGETVTGNFAVPHKKFLQIMKFLLLKSEE